MPEETAQSGLTDNNASALAYVTIIPAIIFLVAAPYNTNPQIKFHAWQSIFLNIALFAVCIIGIIPILGWIILFLGFIALAIVWLMCVIKAFGGGRFVIPVIGAFAAKQAGV